MRGPRVERCARCFARLERCFCAGIPRVEHATEIVIVRHYAEDHRPSNTGRLAALALARCRLVSHGEKDRPLDSAALAPPGSCLLFPDPGPPPAVPPRRLIILDGSWSQARKMRQRLPGLRGVPTLALPGPSAALRTMRTPPRPGQMPTLIAIAEALALLEGEPVAAPLRALFELAVERMTSHDRHHRYLQ